MKSTTQVQSTVEEKAVPGGAARLMRMVTPSAIIYLVHFFSFSKAKH
jgi:hypothetical protein